VSTVDVPTLVFIEWKGRKRRMKKRGHERKRKERREKELLSSFISLFICQ
jgi:hypothetical protein